MGDRPGTEAAGGAPEPAPEARPRDAWRPYVKAAIVVLVLGSFAVILRWTPLADVASNVRGMQAALDGMGAFAPAAFFGLASVAMFVGAPRLVFCTLGGVLFGFVEGLVLSQFATMVGALGPFLFARWGNGAPKAPRLKVIARAKEYLKRRSVMDIFLLRQLPIWGVLLNLILGSSDVPLTTFLVGSFLGYLPQSIVFALIGSGFGEETMLLAALRFFGAGCLLALAAIITWRVMRRRKKQG
jgi:uncharacterized membrane protein YdjX (TVP38/TMEM64 family)